MRAGYRLLAQRLGFVPEDMEKDREVVPGRHHDGDHVPVWVNDRKRRDEAGDARRLTVIDLADRGIAKAELGGLRLKGRRLVELHRRSEEHTSELQSLMRITYAVLCLNKKKQKHQSHRPITILSSS